MTEFLLFSASNDRSVLAEGPLWHPERRALFWVDIKSRLLFEQRPGAGGAIRTRFPEQVSAVLQVSSGGLVVLGERHLFRFEAETGAQSELAKLEPEPVSNRCNDGSCDPYGNLWFGTMDDAEQAWSGSLWCLTRTGRMVRMLRGIGVPNTLAWDRHRKRMYFADSRRGELYVFDWRIHEDMPELGACNVFLAADDAPGVPDGSALSDEGELFNARWDGSCVARVSPGGRVQALLDVPAARPTSCCFGGADHDTLFVTTAAAGAGGGHVYKARGLASGAPAPMWQGDAVVEFMDHSRELPWRG